MQSKASELTNTTSKVSKLLLLMLVVLAIVFSACNQVTVRVESIPENTPPNANIYIAGNFNNWHAGDRNFLLQKDSSGHFFIDLPKGSGLLQYKFNRGDWNTIETDDCGADIPEREIEYLHDDTIAVRIESWKDRDPLECDNITFVVNSLPPNTPFGDSICILGTFNNWDASAGGYTLQEKEDGTYELNLHKVKGQESHEFKFSRGSIASLEGNKFGNTLPNRTFRFGKEDTIFVDLLSWEDMYGMHEKLRTVIITDLPSTTPQLAKLYMAGNFNGWFPRDEKFRFVPNKKGQMQVQIPKKNHGLEFKITRGAWSTQEVDSLGHKITNRKWKLHDKDTLYLAVENWFDRMASSKDRVWLIVNKIPDNTPKDATLYLSANVNDWQNNSRKYQFEKRADGGYMLHVRKNSSDLNFKITRGTKTSQEADRHGNRIVERLYRFGSADSVYIQVENWLDLAKWEHKEVTITLLKVPKSTPVGAPVYIMGNFNNWNPKEEKYKLKRNRKGEYYTVLPRNRDGKTLKFQFTRGSLETVETNEFGQPRKQHEFSFVHTNKVYVEVYNWLDL